MIINEDAVDYVFCYSLGVENVAEALTKMLKVDYMKKRRQFIKKYDFKLIREEASNEKIHYEIKKGINHITKRDNQTIIF